ncbi:MAG: winged helix-turn-helix domain-containing protein [Verrucomicrobiota bacterium JB022]|nr:winged helix-turn-helix domain-containing protein [Verrucomicrobiota bacterium JB022]
MGDDAQWTFFSNHAHVLIALARNPYQPLREVALAVGITERAVQRIVADLEDGGYLERSREGRRNRYTIHLKRPLRHPLEAHCELRELLHPLLSNEVTEKIED